MASQPPDPNLPQIGPVTRVPDTPLFQIPTFPLDAVPQPSAGGPLPELPGYQILAKLGEGGMGVVYKARDRQLGHLVAIKMPLPHCVAQPRDRERFLREARAAAALRHPNICPIHLVDEHQGQPFLVLAYIRGEDLAHWLTRQQPTARASAALVARLARAVEHAHRHGVIHRDLKPTNAMIDADSGEPILMDFGLAKLLDDRDGLHTHTGQILGTPEYMPPEQARGAVSRIGPLSDVYSLGALLYHVLCKRPPFMGLVGDVLRQVQTEEPAPLRRFNPGLHRDLETICLKALAKEPENRYPSALALAEDLERFAAGDAIHARREGWPRRLWRGLKRRRATVTAVGAFLVLLVAGLLVGLKLRNAARWKEQQDDVRSLLQPPEWTADDVALVEQRLAEIALESPEQADRLRRELHLALSQAGTALLDPRVTPRLEAAQHRRLVQLLALLRPRDVELANALDRAYGERQELSELVFALTAPFANLDAVFPPKTTIFRDQQLLNARTFPVVTLVDSTSAMQLEGVFGGQWEQVNHLALILNSATGKLARPSSYRFVLRSRDPSFAAARESGDVVRLQILRDGRLLREKELNLSDIPAGELRLRARRERDRLAFQVNDLPELTFLDLFPLDRDGKCGVDWSGPVPLLALKGTRRSRPSDASPLEEGDELRALGKVQEALDSYRRQAGLSAGTSAGQEARTKMALCLSALNRASEAEELLRSLVRERGSQWPAVAAVHLLLDLARQKKLDEATVVIDELLIRHERGEFADLSFVMPAGGGWKDLDVFMSAMSGFDLLRYDPQRVARAERAMKMTRLFDRPPDEVRYHEMALIRAHRMEGRVPQGIRIAQHFIQSGPEVTSRQVMMVSELCWMLREQGQTQEALKTVDQHLFGRDGKMRAGMEGLLVERARALASLERRADAEKALNDLLVLTASSLGQRWSLEAQLLLGFLREERGDVTGAVEVWRGSFARLEKRHGGGISTLSAFVAGALGGDMSERQAQTYVDAVVQESLRGNTLVKAIPFQAKHCRDCWRTPRGKELARRLAFQQLPLDEYLAAPGMAVALELTRAGAFDGKTTADQEALLWEVGWALLRATSQGKVTEAQLLLLGSTWKGVTNVFGWASLQATLDPALRGPMSYILSLRYRKLGKPQDAERFLQQARSDAKPGSVLQRLLQ